MLKLTKSKLILLGLGIIFLIYSIDRFRHIIGSEKITGTFAFYIEEVVKEEKANFPIIILDAMLKISRFSTPLEMT